MKPAVAVLFLAGIGLMGSAGPAWPDSPPQIFTLTSRDPTANTGTVVARGPITGIGTYVFGGQGPEPFPGEFRFRSGTLSLTITPDPPSLHLDARTCVLRLTTSGTFRITGGAGAYAGASGEGWFAGRATVVFHRTPQGECQMDGEPRPFVGVVDNRATVILAA